MIALSALSYDAPFSYGLLGSVDSPPAFVVVGTVVVGTVVVGSSSGRTLVTSAAAAGSASYLISI